MLTLLRLQNHALFKRALEQKQLLRPCLFSNKRRFKTPIQKRECCLCLTFEAKIRRFQTWLEHALLHCVHAYCSSSSEPETRFI